MDVDDLLRQARELEDAGRLTDAIATYKAVIAIEPQAVRALSRIARCIHDSRLSAEAAGEVEEWCRRALSIDATDRDANFYLAVALKEQFRFDESLTILGQLRDADRQRIASKSTESPGGLLLQRNPNSSVLHGAASDDGFAAQVNQQVLEVKLAKRYSAVRKLFGRRKS